MKPPISDSLHGTCRSFNLMMRIFATGVCLSLVLCVPPWPFLRRHPLPWLKKREVVEVQAASGGDAAAEGAQQQQPGAGGGRRGKR